MTIIDYKNKIIFVRPMSHATTSIYQYIEVVACDIGRSIQMTNIDPHNIKDPLYENGKKMGNHDSLEEIKRNIKNFKEYKILTIVRNPFTYLVSCYVAYDYSKTKISFKEWIKKGIYLKKKAGNHVPLLDTNIKTSIL